MALAAVAFVGAAGYHTLGEGRWSFSDCLYMAIITLSTVGFGETLVGMDEVPYARAWTVALILLGSGTLVYFASTFTALVVEGDLRGALRRQRMNRLLGKVEDHVIVCGAGSTGLHVIEELRTSRTPFVVVDRDPDRLVRLLAEIGEDLLYVEGDASEDEVLELAGIRRARGLVAALHDDRDNLFVTVTARAISDRLRIVAKAIDTDSVAKLRRAGANAVVAPTKIGGMRLASEMVRPNVVQFLDAMTRDPEHQRRIEEVTVAAGTRVAGRSLARAGLRDGVDALVIAIRHPDGRHEYNPSADLVLEVGMVLIVLVRSDHVAELRRRVEG